MNVLCPSGLFCLWLVLPLAACGKAAPEHHALRVLSVNVGNMDELNGGPCPPGAPYQGALCSIAQEQTIRARIDALKPDIAVIVETFDAATCAGHDSTDPDFACTDYQARVPLQQLRRLVGDDYTILCDGNAHHDCLAVRASRITLRECAAGDTCIPGLDTPTPPPACDGIAGISSVSRAHAEIDNRELMLVVMHPLNAIAADTDLCRVAQYRQVFEELADGPTIMAGDFNFDPYRLATAWQTGPYWQTQVGAGKRFTAISADDDKAPTTTWGNFLTLDYVLSDFAKGACEIMGVTPGTVRIDDPQNTMDHNAVSCDVEW